MACEGLLYHFSEDPGIAVFEPRVVEARRRPGEEWLNGPLVWAIDAWHAPCYLFPRECPRILWWPLPGTTSADRERFWGARTCRMIACIEWAWLELLRTTTLYRYTLAAGGFRSLGDHGVHVSARPVFPLRVEPVMDLAGALALAAVELRVMPDLLPLRGMWETSLHVSGIRLRNAAGWKEPRA
jgi:hypothetical protein